MNEAVFVWLVSSVKEIISSQVCRTRRLKKWKKSSWKMPVTIFHFHVTSGMISFPYLFWFHWIIYHNWLSISLIRRNVLVNFVPFVFRQSFANLFSNKSHLFSSNWGHIYIFHMFYFSFLKRIIVASREIVANTDSNKNYWKLVDFVTSSDR